MADTLAVAIIFDFNGVVIDDYAIQKEAWSRLSQHIRQQPVTDQEMAHTIRGVPTRDTLQWMSGNVLDEQRIADLIRQKAAIMQELYGTGSLLQLAPGLTDFLNVLAARRIPRTIATSQLAAVFDPLFEKLQLARWFDRRQVICYDGTYPGKPAPDAYLKAAQMLQVESSNCIVIEDASSGIQAAYAAGVRRIIAIGTDRQLAGLRTMPGVVKTIHTFNELRVEELFDIPQTPEQ